MTQTRTRRNAKRETRTRRNATPGTSARRGVSRALASTVGMVTLAVGVLLAVPSVGAGAVAGASTPHAYVDHINKVDPQKWQVYVYSPSMNRVIPLDVLRPADTSKPRSTLYLLNGAGGGEVPDADWESQTDAVSFFKDKNVNVVIPMEGKYSYYTDWQKTDPELGNNKWTTFLTEELPPVIDSALGTTGVNAIEGLSMSGTSVLALAEAKPSLYKAVGSFSGCAQTSTQPGQTYVKAVVDARGGGDTLNMWGPTSNPAWAENDPTVHADKLRGIALYIANGNGLIGPYDNFNGPNVDGDPVVLGEQIVNGGVIEAATDQCAHVLQQKLNTLNIPATYNFPPNGTHSWGYWQDNLHQSWPMFAKALGA